MTNTGISSARLYWENKLGFFDVKGVTVPAAVSVFPHEIYQAPRSWTERAYHNLIYFNEVDKGDHFAAWQEPELFRERGGLHSGRCVETGVRHEQHRRDCNRDPARSTSRFRRTRSSTFVGASP